MRWLPLLVLTGVLSAVEVLTFPAPEAASGTNVHLLCGPRTAILVNTPLTRSQTGATFALVEAALAQRGLTLTTVFLTDGHPDHTGGLGEARRRWPQARLMAAPGVVADAQRDEPVFRPRLLQRFPGDVETALTVPEAFPGEAIDLDGEALPLTTRTGNHSAHLTTILLPRDRTLLSAELVYHRTHLFLREKRIDGWLAALDDLERDIAAHGVSRLVPDHGAPVEGSEAIGQAIADNRRYLTTFRQAVSAPTAAQAEATLRAAFPGWAMDGFLTHYSLPAYYPQGP